ncbi:Leucine-rich repeat-containing protein 15 [Nymphon striatum]|nr:Leucine-rich repeat-containing protein 15 [Nymphon striatum]
MIPKQVIILCSLLVLNVESILQECPPPEFVAACYCDTYLRATTISCKDDKPKELYLTLEYFSSYKFSFAKSDISNDQIQTLKPQFFGNSTTQQVTFDMHNLTKVDPNAFVGQEHSLEDLLFINSKLTEIPIESINILASLRVFRFKFQNETKAIKSNTFVHKINKGSVEELDIGYNGIKYIEKGAFTPLFALKTISLYHNLLVNIDPSSFPIGINLVKNLNIKHCSLKTLPYQVLSTLPEYAEVNLENNQIEDLSKDDIELILKKRLRMDLAVKRSRYAHQVSCAALYLLLEDAVKRIETDSAFGSWIEQRSNASAQVFNLPNAIKKSGEIWQHRVLKLAKASPSCEGIIEVMDFEAGGKLKRKEKSFSQLLGPVARSLKALSSG